MSSLIHPKKVVVQCWAEPLFAEEPLEHPALQDILFADLQGFSYPDVFLANHVFGQNQNISNYMRYAQNSYTLGLPEGQHGEAIEIDPEILKDTIEEDIDHEIIVQWSHIDRLTPFMATLSFLVEDRGYDFLTDSYHIATPPLELIAKMVDPDTGEAWERPQVYLNSVGLASDNQMNISYIYFDEAPPDYDWIMGPIPTYKYVETYTFDPELTLGEPTCVVIYTLPGSSVLNWWYWRVGGTEYPEMSAAYQEALAEDVFFPVIPLRYHNIDYTVPHPDTDQYNLYDTSKHLIKKLGIDITELGDQIKENPDIGDIDNIFLTHGVKINSQTPAHIIYLGEFFHSLAAKQKWDRSDYIYNDLIGHKRNLYSFKEPTYYSWFDDEAVSEHGFRVTINFHYIETRTYAGTIGIKGFGTSWIEKEPLIFEDPDEIDWMQVDVDLYAVFFRYQLDTNTVREVKVVGLQYANYVYKKYDVKYNITPELWNNEEPEYTSHGFIIPLHYHILNNLPKSIRTEIETKALYVIFTSYDITVLPWYKSALFQWFVSGILMLVAIWLAVPSGGQSITGAVAAISAMTATEIAYMLIVKLTIAFILKVVMSLIIKAIGPRFGILAAVIVLIVAVATKNTTITMMGMTTTTAQLCINMSLSLMTASNNAIQGRIGQVQNDIEDFRDLAKEKWELLEKTIDELLPDPVLDITRLFGLSDIYPEYYETPTDFITRTKEFAAHNPGVIVYETAVHNFTANKLSLENNLAFA